MVWQLWLFSSPPKLWRLGLWAFVHCGQLDAVYLSSSQSNFLYLYPRLPPPYSPKKRAHFGPKYKLFKLKISVSYYSSHFSPQILWAVCFLCTPEVFSSPSMRKSCFSAPFLLPCAITDLIDWLTFFLPTARMSVWLLTLCTCSVTTSTRCTLPVWAARAHGQRALAPACVWLAGQPLTLATVALLLQGASLAGGFRWDTGSEPQGPPARAPQVQTPQPSGPVPCSRLPWSFTFPETCSSQILAGSPYSVLFSIVPCDPDTLRICPASPGESACTRHLLPSLPYGGDLRVIIFIFQMRILGQLSDGTVPTASPPTWAELESESRPLTAEMRLCLLWGSGSCQ